MKNINSIVSQVGIKKTVPKFSIIALILCTILTFVFPIMSMPILLVGLFLSNYKIRKFYAVLLSISIATIAYVWIPDSAADLYRHHRQVETLFNYDYSQLSYYIKDSLEPLHYYIKFFVAQTENINLLQFMVTALGYFEIFWIISDLTNRKKYKTWVFVLSTIYVILSVRFIDFASGLWFNFAIINIAMGIYLKYFRNTKYLHLLFYVIAATLHVGTLYSIILILIFSRATIFKRINPILATIVFASSLFPSFILDLLNLIFGSGSDIMRILNSMYNSYFINDAKSGSTLHAGWSLIIPVINIIFCIILSLDKSVRRKYTEYGGLLFYTALFVLGTLINAGIFIRYGFLVVLLALPVIADILNNIANKRKKIILITIVLVIICIQLPRNLAQMNDHNLFNQISNNATNSIIRLINQQ